MELPPLRSQVKKIALSLSLLSISASSFASGFQLFEYNAIEMGRYGAGGAAIAEDASSTFSNPAGLTRLEHPNFVFSAVGIWPKSDFKGTACGGVGCVGVPTSKDGGQDAVVPATHFAMPYNDWFFFGIGITAPFGLATDYGKGTPLRYSATKSEISVININPVFAAKISDHFSIGAGINIQHMRTVLNSIVNFAPALLPDATIDNDGDDWSTGFNAGALFELNDNTRAGISFQSQIVHHLSGTSELAGGLFPPLKSNLKAKVALPPTTMLSAYHAFNQAWALMGSLVYTKWDTIKQVNLKNHAIPTFTLTPLPVLGNRTGTITLPQNYNNTWRGSAAVDYNVNSRWTVRAGAGFDNSPVRTADRTIRLADNDRAAIAFGASYHPRNNLRLDAGYTHIFIKDGTIRQVRTVSNSVGKSDNRADLFGVQLTWDIGKDADSAAAA